MINNVLSARFAVMGYPIAHSLSPQIHHYFAEQFNITLSYEKILVEVGDFAKQLKHFFDEGGRGLNITAPFKQEAYALAAVRTKRCQAAQAANTLWIKDQQLQADNTDGVGLVRDLSKYLDLTGKRVLILGAGGAARGIIAPLLGESPACLTVMNRTPEKASALLVDFPKIDWVASVSAEDNYDLIINATSAGVTKTPWTWNLACIQPSTFCYDLTYSLSEPSPFVLWAEARGAKAVDGLGMLVEQAAEAFLIWHGVFPETASVLSRLRQSS